MKKVLITGATGLLGSRFYYIFGKHYDVVGTSFLNYEKRGFCYLSLTDKKSIDSLISETNPDIVIHTAGIADPDECEKDKKKAYRINVQGTKYIVDACKKNQCFLVFISSSHIFSNGKLSEKEKPNPINYYGKIKLEAEKYIRRNLKNYIILRVTKLYGFIEKGEDFTKNIIKKIEISKELKLDHVLKYYPVITDDLVELTQKLIDLGFRGIYNISTTKPYTKFEWAKLIMDTFNFNTDKLKPVKKETIIANRPNDLSFLPQKISGLSFKPTSLQEGVYCLKKQMGCSFDLIYSFQPYKLIKGKTANMFRVNLGKALAKEEIFNNSHFDMVVPIPESGIYSAQGYADKMGIPLYHAIIRDYETKKTLYEPQIDERIKQIRKKLIIIEDLVKGKKIVLIDEAVISGLTIGYVVKKLKEAGVNEIHVRIPSPIMFNKCKCNVLSKEAKLITKRFRDYGKKTIEKKLAKYFNVKSFKYLSLKEFKNIIPDKRNACLDCFLQKHGKKNKNNIS
jgi:dTDP-4-dehydrorhamnose reductase